jgi:flagellar basal body L-ring protein FlgH
MAEYIMKKRKEFRNVNGKYIEFPNKKNIYHSISAAIEKIKYNRTYKDIYEDPKITKINDTILIVEINDETMTILKKLVTKNYYIEILK